MFHGGLSVTGLRDRDGLTLVVAKQPHRVEVTA
jgi:hypothetical protein